MQGTEIEINLGVGFRHTHRARVKGNHVNYVANWRPKCRPMKVSRRIWRPLNPPPLLLSGKFSAFQPAILSAFRANDRLKCAADGRWAMFCVGVAGSFHWLPTWSMSSVCYALEHKTLTFDLGVKHANCTHNLTRRAYRKCHFRHIYIDDIRTAFTAGFIGLITYTHAVSGTQYAARSNNRIPDGFP